MRIVFMGTSDFAVPTLEKLHFSSHEIVQIVTQPDRLKGRGRKSLSISPVKKTATKLGYKVTQPETVNSNEFISQIKKHVPDIFIILSFGQILCNRLLKVPAKGAINVHPSLIPKYRGAAPIQWAIINGDKKTGVTTMLMDKGMDTGHILLRKSTYIKPFETTTQLNDRLAQIGSELLLQTIEKIERKSLTPTPQDSSQVSLAPILKKEDGEIKWSSSAKKIESFIRGMNPWPGAFTFHNNKRVKIISANATNLNFNEPPGTILDSAPKTLCVATGKNAIYIKIIQATSGKKLPIDVFLCGYRIIPGSILGKNRKDSVL